MRNVLLLILIAILVIVFVPGIAFSYFHDDIKSKEKIMNSNNTGVVLLDRKGRPFFTFYQFKNIKYVPLASISPYIRKSVIVSEDKEFYSHPGISIKGILRSAIKDVKEGDFAYGGSTITQQLVKNSLLSQDKTFIRKFYEIVLAYKLEKEFSKDEILEMYLNSAYFGEGAFGIENASMTYFGKSAKDLSLAESSFLVSLLPSPSSLSPFSGDINKAKERQKIILESMEEENVVTKEEFLEAVGEDLRFVKKSEELNVVAPHFALMVKDELVGRFGEEQIARSGFRVRTTIDLDKQVFAEKTVKDQVLNLRKNLVTNGSAVVIDPKTGEVLSLVGSYDWFDEKFGKVNMALSPRQPGSSFKPIVYAAAFEKSLITPATVLKDRPTAFEGNYRPKNYDGKFRGDVLVRRALSNSLNVPAVQVMSKLGVVNSVEASERFGITTLSEPSNYGLSLVLGAGEVRLIDLTSVYAMFANEGVKNEPVFILEIDNKFDEKIYQYKSLSKRVLDSKYAFLISSILSDNNARREVFGNALTISRTAAVKTGTTENYKDSLTLGYTPTIAVGVWVGNNDNKPMDNVAGSLGAAPIWKTLVTEYLKDTPDTGFIKPQDVVSLSVCKSNGLLISNVSLQGYTEYFIKGTEPTKLCSISTSDNVSKRNRNKADKKINLDEMIEQRKKELKERLKN